MDFYLTTSTSTFPCFQINWNEEFVDLMHFWEEQFGTEKILI